MELITKQSHLNQRHETWKNGNLGSNVGRGVQMSLDGDEVTIVGIDWVVFN